MSEVPRIVVKAIPNLTSEESRNSRARVWRFVFDCYAKKAAEPSGRDETKGPKPDDIVKAKGDEHDLTNNQTTES